MFVIRLVVAMLLLFLFFVPIVIEAKERRLNPIPTMNNADKRFGEIKKVKTRSMFECMKR